MSVDGKGVVMRTEALREKTREAAMAREHKMTTRLSKWKSPAYAGAWAGAEAVLRLRALRSSRDFDAYWTFHEAQEYKRNHQDRYADGVVPSTVPPPQPRRRPRLKRVK